MNIVEKVVELMTTDLIKDRQAWKNKTNDIKLMIDQLEYQDKESKLWRTHIDY
jgi:hypothetical protein